jgi:hypothetical protein
MSTATQALTDATEWLSLIIGSELSGLQLAEAYSGVGATLSLKFGQSSRVDRCLGRRVVGTRELFDWEVLVEWGRWVLSINEQIIVGDDSEMGGANDALNAIMGRKVESCKISADLRLALNLSGGVTLLVRPNAESGNSSTMSQWIIFRKDRWLLASELSGSLIIESLI